MRGLASRALPGVGKIVANGTSKRLPWEELENTPNRILARLEVPGGWLYRTLECNPGDENSVAMCFVPYPPPEHGG